MKNLLLNLALIGLVPFVVVHLIHFLTRAKYQTSSEGIVLITGASTGIGRHAAEHLANTTKFHILAGVRKQSDADDIVRMQIPNLQPIFVDVKCENSSRNSLQSVKALMQEKSLPFYGLINNAGISRKSLVEYHLMEDVERMFQTNFFGALRMTQMYLPLLRESKGRIVMISSVAAFISRPMAAMYSATKFALEGLSDGLRREVAQFGVGVSIIQPAYVKSQIFQSAAIASDDMVSSNNIKTEAQGLYSKFLPKDNTNFHDQTKAVYDTASDPIVTSSAIKHAIISEYPKIRYKVAKAVGLPATALSWIFWALPDRLEDMFLEN